MYYLKVMKFIKYPQSGRYALETALNFTKIYCFHLTCESTILNREIDGIKYQYREII